MGARGAVTLAVALWTGLALGGASPATAAPWLVALGAALLAWPRRAVPSRIRGELGALLATAAAFALLGAARASACRERFELLERGIPEAGLVARLVARIDEPPRREGEEPSAAVTVLAARPALPRGLRVRLRLPPGSTAEWADTIEVLARLERSPGRRNPGGFDARSAARAAGLEGQGRAWTCDVRPSRSLAAAPLRGAMAVRRAAERTLARAISPAARELVLPLLFGDRAGMSADTDAALRASGLVHLLALSGLHVAWLAGVARALAAMAGGGLLVRSLTGAAAAAAYAIFAGPIPSLTRAVVAEGVAALACATNRAADPVQSLSLAPLVLLACAPAWSADLGFELSCAATLGLVAIGGPWSASCARLPRPLAAVAASVLLTAGAQVAALPLLLARFHALPWTALGGNLAAVPLAEWLLAAAALGAALAPISPGAAAVLLSASEALAGALHVLTRALGAWPGALLATGDSAWPVAAAALGAGALALATAPPRALAARARDIAWRAPIGWLGAACALFAGVCAFAPAPLSPPAGAWWLVVLDVGQGDAIAVTDGHGWWLVDAGPRSPHWDAGEGAVLPFLRWAGVRGLAALLLTHDDGDHTGGARAVLRGVSVRSRLGPAARPGVPGPCARYRARGLARGDPVPVSPRARVLWPPRADASDEALARRGDNAAALVLEVGEGAARALLTADADSLVEERLEASAGVALLKVSHHGSGSSSGAAFLARVRPGRAAISCGLRNRYGHPNAGALARLAAAGAALDRTDREGALWYELDAHGARPLDWRAGEPRRARTPSPLAAGRATAPREP